MVPACVGCGVYAVVGLGFVFFSLSITPFVENERSKKTLIELVVHLRVILAWKMGERRACNEKPFYVLRFTFIPPSTPDLKSPADH